MSTIYVAYYRVSTKKQGESGLGLEAQHESVAKFVKDPNTILSAFTEIESGKSHYNRPELEKAISLCLSTGATLIVAKLDRLARNVAFISQLMESKVRFVACDMPEANTLTIHIIAACAEHERNLISRRTKDALKAAKARGVKLGNPNLHLARQKAASAPRHYRTVPLSVIELIKEKRKTCSLQFIADYLNNLGIRTIKNMLWTATAVSRVLERQINESN